jgi:hypothetical protein
MLNKKSGLFSGTSLLTKKLHDNFLKPEILADKVILSKINLATSETLRLPVG